MSKRVAPLTALQISKTKPHPSRTIELVDGAVPGLRLRIAPSGGKSWSLAMRASGIMRRFDVGNGLSLGEARKKAEELRLAIKDGADPTADRRAARLKALSAVEGIGTFGSVIDTYFTIGNGAGLKTGKVQQKHLRSFFKSMLARPAIDVRSAEIQLAIDAHPAKVTAARAAGYIGPVIKWASKRDLMRGPFNLEKPITGAPRQRVLSETELKRLLPTLDDAYGRCCLFLLLTAARRSEAANATWDQVDLKKKIWTIPGEGRKDTREQVRRKGKPKEALEIPLSEQALKILKQQRRLVRARNEEVVDGHLGPKPFDRIFTTEQGGPLINWSRWLRGNAKRCAVAGWSAHALRRTAATIAGDLGAPPHVISVMLGHSNIGGQLIAGYNKSRYREEHTALMQQIGNRIDQILKGKAQKANSSQ
ncbi:tyrosine-type recombinase/integrase [Croceibacterium aestuarii]|uniref:tyrosine-type recombinase/integrase n=1 Tax=Croceibacterium aestuarii TaxID=3064139 RepID=UPI00272E3527|nr:tyrosine-type recombinase/integrase [Croceibacterium sp. D39]